jgi:hypothetical protein
MRQGSIAMVFADISLARRVEAAEAENARASAVGPGTAVLDVAGGCAVFVGVGSPLTQAVGIGLKGPVSESEIDSMEEFFSRHGANVSIDLCPLADPGLVEALSRRGYGISQFNNVMVRELANLTSIPTPRVRVAIESERDVWSHAVGEGFFEKPTLTEDEMDIGRAIFAMSGASCYISRTEADEVAGGAAMSVHGSLAMLFADTTIARFRRTGLHRELIVARLNDALCSGCDLAAAATLPGSESQRNYERTGFQVVYTRITLVKNI